VIAVFLIRLLPTPMFDWIARVLGVTKSMDDFKGRGSA
jgi:hypothetical protein